MSKAIADLSNPLMRGLACAALHPWLRSILVFDATIDALKFAAHHLALMLTHVTHCNITSVQLGVVETEEDLWGSLAFRNGDANCLFEWQRGVLAGGRDQELRLIIIPDLTRLSLAAARACVALMGSDIAYLERHGHQDAWQPNLCWLAGCSRPEIGMVSPHLLDRFALRLSSQNSAMTDRTESIQRWLQSWDQGQDQEDESLLPKWMETLQQARSLHPEFTLEAQKRVFDYIDVTDGYSIRRDLALLRLAQTNAQLASSSQITAQQVDLAAQMIGLSLINPSLNTISSELEIPIQSGSTPKVNSKTQKEANDIQPVMEKQTSNPIREPVYASDTTETLSSQSIVIDNGIANPYPEDITPVQREAASLRLPLRRFRNTVSGRGAIVGVEPTTTPQDLAIVSTLLEAAKYQQIRRSSPLQRQSIVDDLAGAGEDRLDSERSLILRLTDLRRYRRAVVPEQMLALVLDYTCLQDCKWQESLLPYWQWAYEERASVCLIQVGAANVRHEFQAEKITADKVLMPRIRSSLSIERGRATPLAHGLDLVLQSLRHSLQHGRSAIQQVVLVVISDGRGNVPLEASRTGNVTLPVGQRGIEDALQVAQKIAGLKEVKSVVLNPQPKHYKDLPVKLAQALGARVAEIPPLKVWEVGD